MTRVKLLVNLTIVVVYKENKAARTNRCWIVTSISTYLFVSATIHLFISARFINKGTIEYTELNRTPTLHYNVLRVGMDMKRGKFLWKFLY